MQKYQRRPDALHRVMDIDPAVVHVWHMAISVDFVVLVIIAGWRTRSIRSGMRVTLPLHYPTTLPLRRTQVHTEINCLRYVPPRAPSLGAKALRIWEGFSVWAPKRQRLETTRHRHIIKTARQAGDDPTAAIRTAQKQTLGTTPPKSPACGNQQCAPVRT